MATIVEQIGYGDAPITNQSITTPSINGSGYDLNNINNSSSSSNACIPDQPSIPIPNEFQKLHHKDQEVTALVSERMRTINDDLADYPDIMLIRVARDRFKIITMTYMSPIDTDKMEKLKKCHPRILKVYYDPWVIHKTQYDECQGGLCVEIQTDCNYVEKCSREVAIVRGKDNSTVGNNENTSSSKEGLKNTCDKNDINADKTNGSDSFFLSRLVRYFIPTTSDPSSRKRKRQDDD